MVFQHFNLFNNMTALANVMEAPMIVRRMSREGARQKALALLDLVGLRNRGDYYPLQLSGGQQQRVAIARALAMDPKLMLFDEPTSMLDPELIGEVLEVMRNLVKSGMTSIVVTHELEFAREVCDNLVFMAEGRIVEAGPPWRVLGSPENDRTKEFLRRLNQSEAAHKGEGVE